MDTNDPEILDRLTSKVKINGQFNSDILKDIKLNKLTKDHIKNHHERLAATPISANRMLSALSAVFTWDMDRGGSKLWQKDHNPCYGINKFIENKDKIPLMGKESRIIAERKFDVRKVNKDMLRILGI